MMQILRVMQEMEMLANRFRPMGMNTPSNATMLQALERASIAYQILGDRQKDIVLEAVRDACDADTALMQTGHNEDRKLEDLEAAMKTMSEELRTQKAERDHDKAESERVMEQNHALEEKIREMQAEKLDSLEEALEKVVS